MHVLLIKAHCVTTTDSDKGNELFEILRLTDSSVALCQREMTVKAKIACVYLYFHFIYFRMPKRNLTRITSLIKNACQTAPLE